MRRRLCWSHSTKQDSVSELSVTVLEDVVDVVVGGTPSTKRDEFWHGGIVWVTPTDVTSAELPFVESSARTISEMGVAGSSARVVPAGSVLVSTRATIGPAVIAGCELATNQGVTALVPGPTVDSRWLYFWVRANQREFQSRAAGNTFPEISRSKTRRIPIELPPLPQQVEQATVLSAAERALIAAREHLRAVGAFRDALRRQLLRGMSEGIPRRPLAELGTFARGGSFPRAEQGSTVGDHPVFKVMDMNTPGNERRLVTPENWVTEEQRVRLKMKLWPEGTCVFARVGAALNGDRRRLLVGPSILDDNVLGITPDRTLMAPYYLMLALEEVGMAAMAQQGAVPSVNARMVGAVEVPVPPLDEQARVTKQFELIDTAHEAARRHERASAQVMTSLISRVMGEGMAELGMPCLEARSALTGVAAQ
jgi:type I restriction enzyme S subunit